MTIAITIDVEDWFQVENLRSAFPTASWPAQQYRVEKNVDALLAALDSNNAKATFFVLGVIAERFPRLVRKLSSLGHDVESHGYGHVILPELSEVEIYEDLQKSKCIIENLTGQPVRGYRAPAFSITDRALDTLTELRYEYDSSVYDFGMHGRYGQVDTARFNRQEATVWQHDNGLLEFPLPMLNVLGVRLPWAGGGYFRLIPKNMFLRGVRSFLKNNGCYVFYMHPWEIDPQQPRIRSLSPLSYFKHYYGISGAAAKLDALMKVDAVEPISTRLGDHLAEDTPLSRRTPRVGINGSN